MKRSLRVLVGCLLTALLAALLVSAPLQAGAAVECA